MTTTPAIQTKVFFSSRTRLCLKAIPTILVLLLASAIMAAPIPQLVEQTDPSVPGGAGNVTVDQNTGLTWLDWSITVGISFVEMENGLLPGGSFEGWRHATAAEIQALFQSADLPVDNFPGLSSGVGFSGAAQEFLVFLGATFGTETRALIGESAGLPSGNHYYARVASLAGVFSETSADQFSNDSFGTSMIGHALVRSNTGTLQQRTDSNFPGGANNITFDPSTNLEWLDWTATEFYSFNQMTTMMGAGGVFESWRHATRDEVRTLLESAGLPTDSYPSTSDQSDGGLAANNFFALVGATSSSRTNAISADVSFPGAHFEVEVDEFAGIFSETRADLDVSDNSAFTQGHALVRFVEPNMEHGLQEATDANYPGGENNVTFDPSTNLEWLDWNASSNISYNSMMPLMQPGGIFEGWRHATRAEVRTLLESAELPVSNFPSISSALDVGNSAEAFFHLVGTTDSIDTTKVITSDIADVFDNYTVEVYRSGFDAVTDGLGQINISFASLTTGHALVRARIPGLEQISDPHSPGNANNVTLDVDTNLEWLDWSVSANISYSDMLEQMHPGGEYFGWRHATREEIRVLFENAGLPIDNFPGFSVLEDTGIAARNFQAIFGATTGGPFSSTNAFTADSFTNGFHFFAAVDNFVDDSETYADFELADDTPNFAVGHALVKTPIEAGDANGDGVTDLGDVEPFIDVLTSGVFVAEADVNTDGYVNMLDIEPFVELLTGN